MKTLLTVLVLAGIGLFTLGLVGILLFRRSPSPSALQPLPTASAPASQPSQPAPATTPAVEPPQPAPSTTPAEQSVPRLTPVQLHEAVLFILDQTNHFRHEQGRPPVQPNAPLTQTARSFAEFMAHTGKYGHTADGTTPVDRSRKHGYEECFVAENIAYQSRPTSFTPTELGRGFFEVWKNSPSHRKNMLDPDVTETGVVIARSKKTGTYYAVQMFGRPRSLLLRFAIENRSPEAVHYQIGDRPFSVLAGATRTHAEGRPPEVTFRWPGVESAPQSVKPASGDRFLIEKGPHGFRAEKQ